MGTRPKQLAPRPAQCTSPGLEHPGACSANLLEKHCRADRLELVRRLPGHVVAKVAGIPGKSAGVRELADEDDEGLPDEARLEAADDPRGRIGGEDREG